MTQRNGITPKRRRGADPRHSGTDGPTSGNLLCVSNFRTNAGYAWHFIESLYAALADEFARQGVTTWVAYPTIAGDPASLAGSAAKPVELVVNVSSASRLKGLIDFLVRNNIRTLYLTDRAAWHPAYVLLRMFGVRSIIVHDHTSGERSRPHGAKRLIKSLTRRVSGGLADTVIAVSDYVRRRKIEVDLIPSERVVVSYNSVDIPESVDRGRVRARYNIPPDRPLIVCACRAAEYKGVQHLLSAFQILRQETSLDPVLLYFGSGPYIDELVRLRNGMNAGSNIIFAGYEPDAADMLAGANVCVVPSVWGEAFGLAALEPAARGVPVVASAVGGIPEVVVNEETGLLVPPGDPAALARAIARVLSDNDLSARLASQARVRAVELFSRGRQIDQLTEIFSTAMGLPRQ